MEHNSDNELENMEMKDNEDIMEYKKKLNKKKLRYYTHFMITIKAYDHPRLDSANIMQQHIDDVCEILTREHWITGLGGVREWNTKDQYDESWMCFPHHHGHIPGTCERRDKHHIKGNIRTLLTNVLPESKFDKHWIVFGHHGKKQLANYVNYCMKQGNFGIWKGFKDIQELSDIGNKFYNDERKKFHYGLTFDDKIATTVRILEKEIYKAGWMWKIINHNIVWINITPTGEVCLPNHKMRKIFMTLTKYRVFRNKLYRCINFVFSHITDFMDDLRYDA